MGVGVGVGGAECVVELKPGRRGTDWETVDAGLLGYYTAPGGAYLKQSPVWTIALKHCYCTAAA